MASREVQEAINRLHFFTLLERLRFMKELGNGKWERGYYALGYHRGRSVGLEIAKIILCEGGH